MIVTHYAQVWHHANTSDIPVKVTRHRSQPFRPLYRDFKVIEQNLRILPDDSFDVEEAAQNIVEESLEMGDFGPVTSVDGECARCGDEVVWRDSETDENFVKLTRRKGSRNGMDDRLRRYGYGQYHYNY